jgi:peptidoglycan/LPS O-acetylase OafA/YrhL
MSTRRSENSLATPQHPKSQNSRLPYLPGLDGLRALAVMAVILYHADLRWMPGGFLGVEVFFVISGYLITSLLLVEWRRRGRIDLKDFWLRRARRLLPALFMLIGATLTFAVLFLSHEVASLRADALAAIGYVTNWYLVLVQKSYFEVVGRPSLLRHLWSLAVEEQFYLLWPLLFTVAMRRWSRRRVLLAVLVAAAASTLLMAILYQPKVDPSRVYYGTDTRAAGFLIGAALAFVWLPGQLQGRASRANALLLDGVGLGALGALVAFFFCINEFQPFLYRGGFLAVALTTVVVIAVAVHPRAHLVPGLLGRRLLRWIGLRSYSIYLWHWPVFTVTRPQLDVPIDGLALLVLRLAVTGALAELSYRYVETPIRKGALGRAWGALREARGVRRQWLVVRWAGAVGTLVVYSIVLGESVVGAQPSAPPSYLAVEAINTLGSAGTPTPAAVAVNWVTFSASPTLTRVVQALVTPTAPVSVTLPAQMPITLTAPAPVSPTVLAPVTPTVKVPVTMTPTATTEPTPLPTPTASPENDLQEMLSSGEIPSIESLPTLEPTATPTLADRVTAIGDSVMLGAAGELERTIDNLYIDAEIGRQVSTGIEILRAHRDAGQLGEVVIIHLGNNGGFSARQFDEIMQVLVDVPKVVFVNVKVPRRWEDLNNTVLVEGVEQYTNAVLVDWDTASADHPEFFWNDGMHVRPEGARVYAGLVAEYVKAS